MRVVSPYSAFNARMKNPQEVARTFVPIPQFAELLQTQHSILMGPRGCGKTTLMKMVTRLAQRYWWDNVVRYKPRLGDAFPAPAFEAIYVPSDVRWSLELRSVEMLNHLNDVTKERAERFFVGISIALELVRVFAGLVGETNSLACAVAEALIDQWGLKGVVPTLPRLGLSLENESSRLGDALNRRELALLSDIMDGLPLSFSSHASDVVTFACSVFNASVPSEVRPDRWALCFDELEIAPKWLQNELLSSFRSIDQRFLLKLTWGQVLPELVVRSQQLGGDVAAIRMWYSHVVDAKRFCRDLGTRILQDRMHSTKLTPSRVFGPSIFAQEEKNCQRSEVYANGSVVWNAMVQLAQRDDTFCAFLKTKGLDPTNPVGQSVRERDKCLRKIKPIVLLRETFWKAEKARSRKRWILYAGEEAIYAMSDGNPRYLTGLVNDLLNQASNLRDFSRTHRIPPGEQWRVLTAASEKTKTYFKNYPFEPDPASEAPHTSFSPFEIVNRVGGHFRREIVGPDFKPEPPGSFIVDEDIPRDLEMVLEHGQLIGAFIYVGSALNDVAVSVRNSRFRLSFMLAPAYHLLFRNYRSVVLSSIAGPFPRVLPHQQVATLSIQGELFVPKRGGGK
jgi:energy-coupling factor transporter ATP-binding protein EcfA2